MFGFKKRIRKIVDERLAETGKEVIVQKTVKTVEHHHHYSDSPAAKAEKQNPRQDGCILTDVKTSSGWLS